MTGSRPSWSSFGLDLVTFRVFVAAVEERSLARAAAREHLALSALSRRISELEARSGVALLLRHDRGVEPTAAGEALVAQLRNVFTLLDRIVADLDAFRGGARGHVRVHAHMSAMAGSLPEVLARFIVAHPGIEVVLEEYTSIEILHAVQTGTADVGVLSGAMQTGALHVVPWHNDRLVVVLPHQHALLEREHLRLADLLDEPFVGMQYDSALQRLYRHQAEALGFPLHQRAHASSFESVRRMVEAGLGIAILPSVTVEPFTQSMRIAMRPLDEEWAVRPSMLCIRDPDNLPAAVRLLVHHLAHDHSP
jgi:DNA-binding transcriptional LysR family regulator